MASGSMDFLPQLQAFGLSQNEAKVYLELLKLGQTTAGPLVRRSGLHRQFVYSALEKLGERGLVSYITRNNRKNFSATKPDALLQQETERYRQMQLMIPQLKALGAKGDEHVHIDVFSGRQEYFNNLLTVIDSAARFDRIVRIIGGGQDTDLYSFMGNRYREYVEHARRKRVRKYLIGPGPPTLEHRQRFLREPRNQARYLEHGLSSPSYTRITPELVTTEIFGKDIIVLQIWNRTIARSYLEHFELLWRSADKRGKQSRSRKKIGEGEPAI